MNQLLQVGQKLRMASSAKTCDVRAFLGGGGQGEVYRVTTDGHELALKWYFPHSATRQQHQALAELIQRGAPNERFLWPLELIEADRADSFGYLMPLREARYRGIVDMMLGRVDPRFRVLVTACLELADSYLQLHSRGLCYRDISFGNVFFDPTTGAILICDNDNVVINGCTEAGVLGTPRFMAPEIVRGEAKPNTQTDLFSLAVLLFYILVMHHPLEGKKESLIHCLDLPAMEKLYGKEPLFIFDPQDETNRPDPQTQPNPLAYWPIYPQFLRDLFTRAFTDGIRNPTHGRVREVEWRTAMTRLRDAIVYCAACGKENFYDAEALRASQGQPAPCWSCQKAVRLPPRIRIGNNVTMLNFDTKLYPHHVDCQRLYDFSTPVAEVTRHPTDPNIWGLKNASADRWTATRADGTMYTVDPGQSVVLATGTKIHFGKADGEIRS